MLISFSTITKFHQLKNVIHIGAHLGEEADLYYRNGACHTLWIEANSDLINQLKEHLSAYKNSNVINVVLSEVDNQELKFNISNNGMSSSILDLAHHKVAHPEVQFIENRTLQSKTLNTTFLEHSISFDMYDFMNIDIQGAELLMLKGASEILPHIKCIYIEVNNKELYRGCAMINEIDDYLETRNFLRVKTKWYGNTGWGDAIYIKTCKSDKKYLKYYLLHIQDGIFSYIKNLILNIKSKVRMIVMTE